MKVKILLLILISLMFANACKENTADKTNVKTVCPKKIASLSLASDEILLDIVENDKIIGITYLADNKKLSNIHGRTSGIPHKLLPNLEQIIDINPDLLIVADYIDYAFIGQITKTGINTHFLTKLNSINSINQNIILLGKAVCEEDKATSLVNSLNKSIEELKKRELSYNPTVLYLFPSFFTAGINTTIDDLITTAGGINVGAKAGIDGNKKISREYILNEDPEIIIIGSYSPDEENFIETLRSDKVLGQLKAIINSNVYTIETSHLTTVSHHIIKGIQELSEIIDNYNKKLDENKTKTSN